MEKIRLGISACLLGEKVRYDGGHKLDRFLTETLGEYVEYLPVCPEVECGMGVPREAMRLEGAPESPGWLQPGPGGTSQIECSIGPKSGSVNSKARTCAVSYSRAVRRAAAWST